MTEVMEKIVHFTISGEFITNQARSFWGAEDEQEKALDLLDCVEGLEDADKMAILTGKKKLVGDSSTGIDIEDDDFDAKAGLGSDYYEDRL